MQNYAWLKLALPLHQTIQNAWDCWRTPWADIIPHSRPLQPVDERQGRWVRHVWLHREFIQLLYVKSLCGTSNSSWGICSDIWKHYFWKLWRHQSCQITSLYADDMWKRYSCEARSWWPLEIRLSCNIHQRLCSKAWILEQVDKVVSRIRFDIPNEITRRVQIRT